MGLAGLVLLAWLLGPRREAPGWRLLAAGIGMQFVLALLLLKVPAFQSALGSINRLVQDVVDATQAGVRFVFGYLGGGTQPFELSNVGSTFILAIQAMPLILVMSALSALLFHWRVLPVIVRGFAWMLRRLMRVDGPLGLGTAANVFVGMVEAPLLVRPHLRTMSRADLFALMVAGMATIAGTVMALYASVLNPVLPGALGHLLTASLISAPAAILIARIMQPPSLAAGEHPVTVADDAPGDDSPRSAMDAIARGTVDGLRLLAHVVAMLLVLVALVTLANQLLGWLPEVGGARLSLERMLGWLMAPLAWMIGIPWAEAQAAGSLLGIKTVLNELLAYLQLAGEGGAGLSGRSRLILTYALSGFANLGSLGIMLGGLGAMVPERRAEIVALGMRSVAAGTLASLCTGAVVAVLA
ncbi:MAG: nucleoside:proton symporter [Chromatiales bacterium]|nr:nucleoside:proton symporter [Chromatiales bacterium]